MRKRETVKLGLGGSVQIMNIHVSCDWCVSKCSERPRTFKTRATGTLYEAAARLGCRCTRSGQDVCPDCLAEEGEPPVLAPEPKQGELFTD